MRGEGEAKAMEIFNAAHGKNPAFYQLLKTLETYRMILDEQTTVVLSAESPLLKLLTHGLPEPNDKAAAPSASAEADDEQSPAKVKAAPTASKSEPTAAPAPPAGLDRSAGEGAAP